MIRKIQNLVPILALLRKIPLKVTVLTQRAQFKPVSLPSSEYTEKVKTVF